MAEKNNAVEPLTASAEKMFAEVWSEYAGYFAASNSRYLPTPGGIAPMGSGADYHYRTETEYLRMLERARFFDRDNMVVGQGVTRLIANVLQEGYSVDPDTGDEALDEQLRAGWWDWAEDPEQCDYEGERDWFEFEQAALRHMIVDGDICCLPLSTGQLQWREAHCLRNPFGTSPTGSIIHGVELDEGRRRVAYHITPEEISPLSSVSRRNTFKRIPSRDPEGNRQVLHLYNPKRLSQTRGVTAFAPSVVPIQYHEDLQFATLLKAKVASFIAVFHELSADAPPTTGSRQGGSRTTESQADGSTRVIERTGIATTVRGVPGEKLQGFSPNIPNPEFFPHAALILSIVSINLDLPLAVFMLDPSKTNFSSWRGAIDQARGRFRQIQRWQISRMHKPVYQWRVRHMLSRDPAMRTVARMSGVNVFAHTWKPPKWRYIEPLKDAQADDLRASRNLSSQTEIHGERGQDWCDVSRQIVRDRARHIANAIEVAAELNGRYPDAGVTWRELAYDPRDSSAATDSTADDGENASSGTPGVNNA